MTEQLCDFPTCELARKKGFNEVCRDVWVMMKEGPVAGKDLFASPDINKRQEMREIADEFMVISPCKNSCLPGHITARPTQALLARWLREVHQLNLNVYPELGKWEINVYSFIEKDCMYHSGEEDATDTYEQGMEAGLQEALNLLPDANH